MSEQLYLLARFERVSKDVVDMAEARRKRDAKQARKEQVTGKKPPTHPLSPNPSQARVEHLLGEIGHPNVRFEQPSRVPPGKVTVDSAGAAVHEPFADLKIKVPKKMKDAQKEMHHAARGRGGRAALIATSVGATGLGAYTVGSSVGRQRKYRRMRATRSLEG